MMKSSQASSTPSVRRKKNRKGTPTRIVPGCAICPEAVAAGTTRKRPRWQEETASSVVHEATTTPSDPSQQNELVALTSKKVAGTKQLPLLPDTAAVGFSDCDPPNDDERETSTGEAEASAAKPTSSILNVVEQQTYTAPSHEISYYLPYMNRPVRKIKRPFDQDDDGSEAYMSPSEEEIYFHRGALHHFLTHCKVKNNESKSDEVEKDENTSTTTTTTKADQNTMPEFFYFAWYHHGQLCLQLDRFSSHDFDAENRLRLQLINIVCGRDFFLQAVRSNMHRVPCEDCGTDFELGKDYRHPTMYALHEGRYRNREKLCMDCVQFRSNLFLRLTEDKRSLRRTNQLYLALLSRRRVLDDPLWNFWGRDGVWDKGLTEEPILLNNEHKHPILLMLNIERSNIRRTCRELLQEANLTLQDIRDDIPYCGGCPSRDCCGCNFLPSSSTTSS